jgi:hypothetical protein
MVSYQLTVEQDEQGLYIQFTPEMLEQLGWAVGDKIYWEDLGTGSWSLSNKAGQNFNPVCTICTPGECVHLNC